MPSKIFEKIVERNIEQFVGYFSNDSGLIYKDEKNKLIHPGEYGKYREESCKRILRLMLNKKFNLSDGFIITADDQITTQCDLIIYNASMSPIIADDISKMFPAEEVRAIVEIKSDLSKSEYIDALRKMAKNKKIVLDGRKGPAIYKEEQAAKQHDTIGSFLICNNLKFDYTTLSYEEIYGEIDRQYWHNSILSIENGVFLYNLEFDKFPYDVLEQFKPDCIDVDISVDWEYSTFYCGHRRICTSPLYHPINEIDKYKHIKCFLTNVCICCDEAWEYMYEPILYLGMAIEPIFKS